MKRITPDKLPQLLRDIEGQYTALYHAANTTEEIRKRLHDGAAHAHYLAGLAKKYEERIRYAHPDHK
ncbi:hypothetical protein [Corynebacterium sp. 11254D000AR]